MSENEKTVKKTNSIRLLVGFLLILVAIIGLINVGYVGQTITIMFTFVFGWVAYWFIFPAMIGFGIFLIAKRKSEFLVKKGFYLILGASLLFIGLLLISTVFTSYPSNPDPKALSISTFVDKFWASWIDSTKNPFVNNYLRFDPLNTSLGGGFFGYLFAGLFNSALTAIGTIIIAIAILIIALIILFHKPIKKSFVYLKAKLKTAKEKRAQKREEQSNQKKEQVDSEPQPTPMIFDPKEQETVNETLPRANIYSSDEPPAFSTDESGFDEEAAKPAMIVEDEEDEEIPVEEASPSSPYVKPSFDMLTTYEVSDILTHNEEQSKINTEIINRTFQDLKIGAKAISYTIGPRVTRYDIQMEVNSSIRSIPQFVLDISQRLGGVQARFEPIVTGKMTSGLEVPNAESATIAFKEVVTALPAVEKVPLSIPFGKNISGEIKTADLASFPHMLIAGATGSGKSVFVHSIIMSLIMRNTPDDIRLLLIDPKQVEFTKYKNSPFLICPTVTDPKKAQVALQKLCEEMDRRYSLFAEAMVNQIKPYNAMMKSNGKAVLPYIVVIVDEFADLIQQNKKIDVDINRIAAKARAAGIHLIIATQRPSVDVITGTIKANLPVRVALRVPDQESSKTILGGQGAEGLLGNGDMLVSCPQIQSSGNFRCQGCYVSDQEIIDVVKFINNQRKPQYDPRFMDLEDHQVEPIKGETKISATEARAQSDEELYEFIKEQTYKREYTSISLIERENGIGFTRAGRMFKRMQEEGLVAYDSEASKGSKVFKEKFNIKEHKSEAGSAELTSTKPNEN